MKNWWKLVLSMSVAIVLILHSFGSAVAGEGWNITDLGSFGYEIRIADINDAGVVVGYSLSSHKAFMLKNGAFTYLGTNGGDWSEATAINKSGQIIGMYGAPFRKAFFWDKGEMIDLGNLGGQSTTATAINDSGQVAGYSQTATGDAHAFIWQNGVMSDLGTLGGVISEATAINNVGEVAGVSTTASNIPNVFVWNKGEMQDLGRSPLGSDPGYDWSYVASMNKKGEIAAQAGLFPHSFIFSRDTWLSTSDPDATHHFTLSFATVINDKGLFAGTYFNIEGNMLGFVWADGETSYINKFDKEYEVAPGYNVKDDSSVISGMNNKGEVVGSSFNLYGPGPHAFTWKNGVTTMLPTLFGDESRALAINKSGEIVGMNGGHVVLWTKK